MPPVSTPRSTMMQPPLARLRESLGFSLDEVAAHCRWSISHLRQLEASDDIDDDDALTLSAAYGVDVVRALEGHSSEMTPVSLRALLRAQASHLDADSRFAITEAAGVAFEAAELRKLLHEDTGWQRVSRFRHQATYDHPRNGVPEKLANQVRAKLNLGDGPIMSLQRDVLQKLHIQVIVTQMAEHIDAVSFASSSTGGVIVLNRSGSHARSAFGRRVTLAHELCHILFDRPKMRDFRGFCSIAKRPQSRADERRQDSAEAIERRARAFAVYLLAPRDAFSESWRSIIGLSEEDKVRAMMERFGMGYEAVRSHLENLELLELRREINLVNTEVPAVWDERDPLNINLESELEGISFSRRGGFLDLVGRCWERGVLSESGARAALHTSLSQWPLVLDFLAQRYCKGLAQRAWITSSASFGLFKK